MSSKADNEKQKLIQDKCQIILGNLLREEDNKYCVDCDAKGEFASYSEFAECQQLFVYSFKHFGSYNFVYKTCK